MKTDLETLRLFNEKVERLYSTRLARRLAASTPEVAARFERILDIHSSGTNISVTGIVRADLTDHDQDDIDAFVLTYRMFVQRNDRISVYKLEAIYGKDWMPPEAALSFTDALTTMNDYLDSSISASIGETSIARRQLVDIMLYGGLAHINAVKEDVYRSWTQSGMAGFFWVEFVVTMKDMLRYLSFFRELNAAVIANAVV